MSAGAAYRWGRAMARHRRAVLAGWVVVLIACAALYPSLKHSLGAPNYGIDKAESTRAAQLLETRFAAHGAEQDVLVFFAPAGGIARPAARAVIAGALARAGREPWVRGVVGPFEPGARGQVSADGHAAIALVGIAGDPRQLVARATTLQQALDPLAHGGVHVWLTGYSPVAKDITTVENEDVERAETIGVPIALMILLIALGAAVAALVPLVLAGSGLLLTYGLLAVLATALTFDSFLTTIVTMIGVGIGIDYSLFIVSRFREELARRVQATDTLTAADSPAHPATREQIDEAVGAAIASSGRTVLFSGVVVALALATLGLIGAPTYREFALGAVSVVACTVIVALTLLPAVLALLGSRIDRGALPARMQPRDARAQGGEGHGVWARWALAVMRRPVLAAGVIAAVLTLAAVPLLGLRTGVDFGIASLSGTPSGKGERVLARSFGAGALAPIEIVIARRGEHGSLDPAARARVARLARELAPSAHDDIAAVVATPG
jgi:RND superfamily putative drug exporter